MSSALPLTDDDLNAFADNRLTGERARQIALVLEREPALAARVAEIRRLNTQLRDALDPWLAEPLPRALVTAAKPQRAHRRDGLFRAWPALAAAASLIVGVAIGWQLRGEILREEGTPDTFQRQAALTHALYAADPNRPVEIWANEEERLVR